MARNAIVSIILRAKDLASPVFRAIQSGATKVKASIFSIQGAMASLGATVTASVIIGFLVRVNREYARLTTQLQTFSGSREAANAIFRDLAKFAAETPFQITELTRAYVQLRAAGIRPTMETMRLLGDQAAAMGVTMDEVGVAIRSAVAGEFEPMARTLGVKMLVVGNQLSATFDGVTKMIGRDTKSIINFLEELSEKKFAGGMERQSKTIDGALSNLEDAFESLGRAIGDAGLTQDITSLTRALTDFINAGSGLENLRLYFLSIRSVVLTIFDAVQLVAHAAFTPIQLIASTAAGIVNSLVGIMVGALLVPAAMIDSVTGNRFNLAEKMRDAAGARFKAAGTAFSHVPAGVKALGENIGETFAKASLRGEAIDRAAADAALADGRPASTAGGMTKTGRADASSVRFNPKDARDAETARKKVISDLQDQASLLQEQIDLRVQGADALQRAVALEDKMRQLMGAKSTTDGERLSLLKQINELAGSRREAGLLTRAESDRKNLLTVAGSNLTRYAGTVPNLVDRDPSKDPIKTRVGRSIKEAIGDTQTLNQIIADMTTHTLQGFGSAVETAFAAMSDGSIGAAQAFAGAMLGAIGEVASGLGQLALGKAGIAIGDGLLGDPKGFAAAAKYLLAATALFGVVGLMKGKASSITSGGGRSGRSDSERATSDLSGSKGDGTLVIEGDVLDLTNPRTERAFKRALETMSGRKVRVKKSA